MTVATQFFAGRRWLLACFAPFASATACASAPRSVAGSHPAISGVSSTSAGTNRAAVGSIDINVAPVVTGRRSAGVVAAYVDAFNRHSVADMLLLADTNVVWLSVFGDSIRIETSNARSLAPEMVAYFRRLPTARSDISAPVVNGSFVAVRETAQWDVRAGTTVERRAQSSLAVYEVQNGRIRRVWYYPVERN